MAERVAADLHTHATASDGRPDVGSLPDAAQAAGLAYVAVTDSS